MVFPNHKVVNYCSNDHVKLRPNQKEAYAYTYYFALALRAGVRHAPDDIQNLFLTRNNPVGMQVLRIPVNGHQRDVVIDDYLPFKDISNKELANLEPTEDGYLWPCLL